MRIISKFKDYYDSQMAFGFDPKIIFDRNQRIIDCKSLKSYNSFSNFRIEYYCDTKNGWKNQFTTIIFLRII